MLMTPEQIKAYLKRLGINEIHEPTKEYLFEIHKAHVEKIPWESVDVYAGRPRPIDYTDSVQLVLEHRSGYCFHLNGALYALLRSLGYQVSLHRGGVQSRGTEPRIDSFHVGLTVDLPIDSNHSEKWVIDAGLGDIPYEPLPLKYGTYQQGPLTCQLTESSVAVGGWRLEHDPRGPYAGVDIAPETVEDIKVFEPNHKHLSTSPESPFTQICLIKNRTAIGTNEMRGCIFTRIDHNGVTKTEVIQKGEWFGILADIFHEKLDDYSSTERDELWNKVYQDHQKWKREQEDA